MACASCKSAGCAADCSEANIALVLLSLYVAQRSNRTRRIRCPVCKTYRLFLPVHFSSGPLQSGHSWRLFDIPLPLFPVAFILPFSDGGSDQIEGRTDGVEVNISHKTEGREEKKKGGGREASPALYTTFF